MSIYIMLDFNFLLFFYFLWFFIGIISFGGFHGIIANNHKKSEEFLKIIKNTLFISLISILLLLFSISYI